jgi:hypothetical protein
MRKQTPVDRNKLISAINQAELGGPLNNLDTLWRKAADIYNGSGGTESITFSIVCLRAKEWDLLSKLKTKAGKRGRGAMTPEQKAAMQAGRGKRTPRAEKFKKFSEEFAAQRKTTPESKHGLIDRSQSGSAKAAIHAYCYDCSGNSMKEAKLCLVQDCRLYHLRPGAMPYNETLAIVNKEAEKEAEAA